jgi:hypothetical protein
MAGGCEQRPAGLRPRGADGCRIAASLVTRSSRHSARAISKKMRICIKLLSMPNDLAFDPLSDNL